ncbi:hypothetical protein D9M71_86200 [compost metagenome]
MGVPRLYFGMVQRQGFGKALVRYGFHTNQLALCVALHVEHRTSLSNVKQTVCSEQHRSIHVSYMESQLNGASGYFLNSYSIP